MFVKPSDANRPPGPKPGFALGDYTMKRVLLAATALVAVASFGGVANAASTGVGVNVPSVCEITNLDPALTFNSGGVASDNTVFVRCNDPQGADAKIEATASTLSSDELSGPDYTVSWDDVANNIGLSVINWNPAGANDTTIDDLNDLDTDLAVGTNTTLTVTLIGGLPVFSGDYDTQLILSITPDPS